LKPEGASLTTLALAVNKLEAALEAQRLDVNALHKLVTAQAQQITSIFGDAVKVEKQ
jgi:hypothetical protein